ncbi:hypothetical protein [Sphingomicrobium lutaoense]|uniref:Uncharacterized protein n=1 Tax=Sphingomicrobium lutaoense TaxID=515949 RepID=A0A839YYJ3_9SPHN|nr:hypothetical protein [Sphingomicrobium lutaoense]MBB3763388.1 hypothetical protein [Sphingomicrobium lutaoense]
MDSLFISGPAAVADAAQLIETYGDDAGLEAAARAEKSRSNDNIHRFCHWRQIERMIAAFARQDVSGTVH